MASHREGHEEVFLTSDDPPSWTFIEDRLGGGEVIQSCEQDTVSTDGCPAAR